jgi:tetratricopeptide (TPR) repeat protein
MQKKAHFVPVFLLILITMPCISAPENIGLTHSPAPTIENKSDLYDQFMQASYLHAKGKNEGAIQSFNNVMKTRPSEHIFEPYLQALFDGERFSTLVKTYENNKKKIDSLFNKNHMIKAYLAQAYLAVNKESKALALFQELMRDHGNDVQMCYFTAVGYLKTKRLTAAVKLLQECITNIELKSKHYLFHFLLSKAHLEANRPAEAMISIEQSIAQFPKFDRGWLFKAILHEQQGKINEAINGYKKFLAITGRDQSIEKQLVQLLFNQQRYGEAVDYLKKLSVDSPEYCFDLALVQSKSGNYTEALPSINKVLELSPTLEKAKLLKLEILLNSDKTDEAITSLQEWLSGEPQNMGALHTFTLLAQGGVPVPKLITALEAVQIKHPTSIGIAAALGDLALEINQPEKALTHYAQAATHTNHKQLKSHIYFQRCYIMLNQKDYLALTAELTKAEQDGCTNDALLNLQACYFGQTNQQLDKALSIINKALKIKPGYPAYLDTKARILHAKGRPVEALQLAQKALSLAPDDQIIKQHAEELERYALQPSTSTTYTMRRRR